MFYLVLLCLLLGIDTPYLTAMMASTFSQTGIAQNPKKLIIKNDFPDRVRVVYNYKDGKIKESLISQNETKELEKPQDLEDLHFLAYGMIKERSNVATPTNYRPLINSLVWNENGKDILITITPETFTQEQTHPGPAPYEAAAAAAPSQPAASGISGGFWNLASAAWQKTKQYATSSADVVLPWVTPFRVHFKEISPPELQKFNYRNVPLYAAFPSAQARVLANKPVYGRHILNVPEDSSVASILAERDQLRRRWQIIRDNFMIEQDALNMAYANKVLELISEAAQDINKTEFSKDRLSERG